MGGFRIDGCGTKDYFTKMKYLGDIKCPHCNQVGTTYLEKGKLKISVFFIPTVTLKERYAIMCEKCEQGRWIEDIEAHRIMAGEPYDVFGIEEQTTRSGKVCSNCGAELYGDFCGKCGAKNVPEQKTDEIPVTDYTVSEKRICSSCGFEVDGVFCSNCGQKYSPPVVEEIPSKKICPNCGIEVGGVFCGMCGTKCTL